MEGQNEITFRKVNRRSIRRSCVNSSSQSENIFPPDYANKLQEEIDIMLKTYSDLKKQLKSTRKKLKVPTVLIADRNLLDPVQKKYIEDGEQLHDRTLEVLQKLLIKKQIQLFDWEKSQQRTRKVLAELAEMNMEF